MPIEVPNTPKVYTTVYDNFKGIDFTNDPTNVWRRRSPTGVNMLPDESGRPFKRHGWNILISNSDLCSALEVESCSINKCSYFELAGVDHIVVFTNQGVVFYNGDETATAFTTQGVTAISKEYDCYSGYDRSFFFEGNGMAAFYIYGNFRVWRYSYDNGFVFSEVTNDITIPTVLISTSADGTGTPYEGYNLLGTKSQVLYSDYSLYTYWGSDGLSFTVPDSFKEGKTINAVPIYRFTWDGTEWTSNTPISLADTGIVLHNEPKENDEICILYIYGVMLPNNVAGISDVSVDVSMTRQFDYPLAVDVTAPLNKNSCRLFVDNTNNRERGRAWIQFYDDSWNALVDGEDFIRVVFSSVNITVTPYEDLVLTDTASLVGA